jgi:hypothetical protein
MGSDSTDGKSSSGAPVSCRWNSQGQPAEPEEEEKASTRKKPLEERKNFGWIEGLRDSHVLASELPSTRQVCVMDREADVYELFCEPRPRQVELLCASNMTVVRMAPTSCLRSGDEVRYAPR